MLHRLPKHLPPLATMLNDLGNPSAAVVAKALDVSVRTVRRWIQQGHAPRPVLLSLFWLTRWGVSQIHCDAHNDALRHAQLAAAYRSQYEDTQAKLDQLGRIADFGAANDPMPEVRRQPPALPALAPAVDLASPAPKASPKKTARQKREALVQERLAKRASGPPHPFNFLRAKR